MSKVLLLICVFSIFLILVVLNYRIHGSHVLTYEGSQLSVFNQGYGFDDISKSLAISNDLIMDVEKKLNKKILKSKTLVLSYRLQLLGLKKESREVVFFNGFCLAVYDRAKEYWKRELVGIIGGGKCFFNGVFDIESKEIIEFEWNS